MKTRNRAFSLLVLLLSICIPSVCVAQGTPADVISVRTTSLTKAFLRQPYHAQLEAQGGIPPLTWQVSGGALADGLSLDSNGLLSGTPTAVGEFRFVVTVTDNGKPAHQRSQEWILRVVAPLLAEWSKPLKVTGHRVDGAIKVSNQTGEDFDLTMVVLAVNENGRATAIGYQHFTLKSDLSDFEIPFGENLPQGSYAVNVDVVAEVPTINRIYRARLAKENLQVVQGP